MTSHRRRILWVVALTGAFLVSGTGPAGAHVHPTPTERAAPAVVYVEARADVQVALVEHRQSDPAGVHIAIIQSRSDVPLASASGFVVDPTGTVVTTGAVAQNDLDRAKIYAVNEAFRKQYGANAPLAGDLYTRQSIGDATNLLQQRLDACYPPYGTNDAGGCVVTATPTYVVHPYVTPQADFGQPPAELVTSTPDVAVLRVRGATSMPTVPLAESTKDAQALSVLGFTGIPGDPQEFKTHLAEKGGSVLQSGDMPPDEAAGNVALADSLKNGIHGGGPVVAEQGQVIGFLVPDANSGPPPATAGRLVDARAINEVLSAAKVTPRRGPVDTSFEKAMHAFKNGGFAAAIPDFKAALAVFPGHALANRNLAVSEQNVASGSPGTAPSADSPAATSAAGSAGGFPWTVVLLAVAAVLVLAAVAVLLLRRRRQGADGGVTPAPGKPRPAEGRPAAPSRSAAVGHEHRAVSNVATTSTSGSKPGSKAGPEPGSASPPAAVGVLEGGGSGRGGAPSHSRAGPAPSGSPPPRSSPGKGPAAAVGDGAHRPSRVSATPAPRDAPVFCTSCGLHLAPHYRYCPRCGEATR
jgi:hypothetical protein